MYNTDDYLSDKQYNHYANEENWDSWFEANEEELFSEWITTNRHDGQDCYIEYFEKEYKDKEGNKIDLDKISSDDLFNLVIENEDAIREWAQGTKYWEEFEQYASECFSDLG